MRSLNEEANTLLDQLLSHHTPSYGLGHASPSIYDNSWVSMVSKENRWLFPSAFQYILDHQSPSGGWESSTSEMDSIMNTLGALLSLTCHSKAGQFSDRISSAVQYLSALLQSWDVPSTERVGFEVTVPSILSLLSKQGIEFHFPHHSLLMELREAKLSKLVPEAIFQFPTSILHSLEGFIGYIDFDKLTPHKCCGSFMASPSSTAAYLMYASVWDDDCEAYLRQVLLQYEIYGEGSVPSVWPTTYFEISWIVCNLRESGFKFDHLNQDSLAKVVVILKQGVEEGRALVGLASGFEADADDTAKVIVALHYLGIPTTVDPLCNAFECDTHFKCYPYERNPSISVQCNVLSALLEVVKSNSTEDGNRVHSPNPRLRASIQKTVTFISETWWTINEQIIDKWNNSTYYVLLLIAQSLSKFMLLFDKGAFPDFPEALMRTKIPVTLFQILVRLLQAQNVEGSWGSCEETAYALLALTSLTSLPFVSILHDAIQGALDSGRKFLMANACDMQDTKDQICLWTDKVNYRIPQVSYSYVLSALHATNEPVSKSSLIFGEIARLNLMPTHRIQAFLRFYHDMPLFRNFQEWQLKAYVSEGYLYVPMLESVVKTVFGDEGVGKGPYAEYIPFCWTSANAMYEKYSSPQNCFGMMELILVIYIIDDFFDLTVQDEGTAALPALRQALHNIFSKLGSGNDIATVEFGDGSYSNMVQYMHKYIYHIVEHPSIQNASHYDKAHLLHEFKAFLLSMVQAIEDNARYAAQGSWGTLLTPASSYLKWVRTVGSDSIGGHFSASFFICLLSPGTDAFPTPKLKFLAQDCITHVSALSRVWNDLSSIQRDRAERNINGVIFPEFAGMDENEVRREMIRIADYERSCLNVALDQLCMEAQDYMGNTKGNKLADKFGLFFKGSDIFNAIYQFKDIGNWKFSQDK